MNSEEAQIDEKKALDTHVIEEEDPLTEEEQKRVWLKCDLRVIPPLTLIYLLQYMDKSNIGNAKVAGLEKQLNISSDQYTWVLSIFYFSYGLCEIPSNMILKRMRPSIWLCALCVSFGLCLALLGLSTSYSGLLAGRFFLGVTTAGVYPGASYFFTLWYPRDKLAFRFSLFFVAATLAGSFSGLLSAAIGEMSGINGREGWSWIFIIMGCVAILGGIILFPFMHDYPETAKFLTQREKDYVLNTLAKDQGQKLEKGSSQKLSKKDVWKAFSDWQTWSFTLQYYCSTVPLFSIAIFVPSIVGGLGYSGYSVQLMSVPPFAMSVPFVIGIAWLSDRYKRRAPFIAGGFLVGLIGWIILRTTHTNGARYAAVCIASIGHWSVAAPSNMASANCYVAPGKRAVALGFIMGIGNLCGIITANVFRSSDAPYYYPGIHGMLFFAGCGFLQTLVLWFTYSRINAKREKLWQENPGKWSEEELQELGDRAPNFKYLYP